VQGAIARVAIFRGARGVGTVEGVRENVAEVSECSCFCVRVRNGENEDETK